MAVVRDEEHAVALGHAPIPRGHPMLVGPQSSPQRTRGVFPYTIVRFLVESTIGPGVTLLHHPGIDVLVTEEDHRKQELVSIPVDDSQRHGLSQDPVMERPRRRPAA